MSVFAQRRLVLCTCLKISSLRRRLRLALIHGVQRFLNRQWGAAILTAAVVAAGRTRQKVTLPTAAPPAPPSLRTTPNLELVLLVVAAPRSLCLTPKLLPNSGAPLSLLPRIGRYGRGSTCLIHRRQDLPSCLRLHKVRGTTAEK